MASISCGSSASTHRTNKCESDNRAKSTETNCTSNSSCFFKRRKPMNPLAYSVIRPNQPKPNPVKQRVMSAKMIKLRQLQSQLNDANYHLAEVTRENQILKTLQKRQEKAIFKYENTNADLPRLIRAHEEEIRNLTERNKALKRNIKDLTEQLKIKEEELTKVKEQLSRLEKLDKDKHLSEREKLIDKVEDLKMKLYKSEEQVTTLNRKLILETKISKQRLNAELVKQKQQQKELIQAFNEIDRLTNLLEGQDNVARPRKAFFQFGKQSMSMVHLNTDKHLNRTLSNERQKTARDAVAQNPVTDVKLEPIYVKRGDIAVKNDNFTIPMENIKQRLSNGHIEEGSKEESFHQSRPSSSIRLKKLVVENQKINETNQELQDFTLNKQREEEHRLKNTKKFESENQIKNELQTKNSLKMTTNKQNKKEMNQMTDREFYNNKEWSNSNSSDERDVDTKKSAIQKTESLESFELNEKQFYNQKSKEIDDFLDLEIKSGGSDENFKTKQGTLKKGSSCDLQFRSLDDLNLTPKNKKKPNKESANNSHSGEDFKSISNNTEEKLIKSSSSDSNFSLSEEETLKKFSTFDKAIKKATENSKDEFDKKLGEYCSDVVNSVKTCGKIINLHKNSLKHSRQNTDTLIESFKNTAQIESKLRQSFFDLEDGDMSFVNEILTEEFKFKKENPKINNEQIVNPENKRKLLATLRAIDNGDSIESLDEQPSRTSVMKEIFGSVGH